MFLMAVAQVAADSMRYIDNGQVRLGVDLNRGGAITYLSRTGGPNIVNDYDLGRQIQMSYYSGPVPFEPAGKKPQAYWAGLGWNPIQSGDCFGHPSKTLEFRSSGRRIYLKCIPMQWPLDNEPGECTFEAWIQLNGATVEVKNRIVNHRTDFTQYPRRTQELPAVYSNAPWYNLVTFTGAAPFTDDAVTVIPPHPSDTDGPWNTFRATEHWAALLDDHQEGLGIWAPEVQTFTGGFYGTPGTGGSADVATGYMAPKLNEILDHDIVYDSRYVLIVGNLDAIRRYAKDHAGRLRGPEYRFRRDRQHWTYVNAVDAGWPIRGELRVSLEQPDPQMIGPAGLWSAFDNPTLEIQAAFKTQDGPAKLFWERVDALGFREDRSITFLPIPDGRYHTYRVDLSASPEYRGAITQLRLDPEVNGHPGDEIRVRSIRLMR